MENKTIKYWACELSLSIQEWNNNLNYAQEQRRKGNDYGVEFYIEECHHWAERAINAADGLSLSPNDVCPRQVDWLANFNFKSARDANEDNEAIETFARG